MDFLRDRRIVIGLGIALALLAGILIAYALGAGGTDPDTPPPASVGGLIVEVEQPDLKIDLNRELPCYVSGQLIGLTTHAECAQRNGVSSGQLDVGIGPEGELAFGEAGLLLAPLPPEISDDPIGEMTVRPVPVETPAVPPPVRQAEATATCWRYAGPNWQRLSDMPLNACVQILYDGRCERAGGALYGRWGDETLRLVPGQVERSSDNRNFRTLVQQGPNCSIAFG